MQNVPTSTTTTIISAFSLPFTDASSACSEILCFERIKEENHFSFAIFLAKFPLIMPSFHAFRNSNCQTPNGGFFHTSFFYPNPKPASFSMGQPAVRAPKIILSACHPLRDLGWSHDQSKKTHHSNQYRTSSFYTSNYDKQIQPLCSRLASYLYITSAVPEAVRLAVEMVSKMMNSRTTGWCAHVANSSWFEWSLPIPISDECRVWDMFVHVLYCCFYRAFYRGQK